MTVVSRARDDRGFTLSELLVVLSLLGFILAVAYAAFNVTSMGSSLSNRQAWMSREVAAPLEFAERVITQRYAWYDASPGVGPYRIAIYTDRDNDGHRERYIIEAHTDHRLTVTSSEEVDSPTPKTATWSTANYNRAAGVPLFRYYDAAGAEITTMSNVYAYARSVKMTIVTEYDGTRFTDGRTMFMRN